MGSFNNLHRDFIDLRLKNSNIQKFLKPRRQEQEELLENMASNIENVQWDQCIRNVELLNENTKQIHQTMEQQNKIIENTFSITEEILNLLNSKETLSCFRDWISAFIAEVEGKLGSDTWQKVKAALNFKRREKRFRQRDIRYISQLENILNQVYMDITEFELLLEMKITSNVEFHSRKNQTSKEALKQLDETSFPDEFKNFKNPLKKAIEAINRWDEE